MLDDLDQNVSDLSESIARQISRRRFIGTAVKGLFATAAGLTAGHFLGLKDAFAVTCTCTWFGGSGNANCPSKGGCPSGNCPAGCSLCTSVNCPGTCPYASGSWTSCTGLGSCGFGYRICRDCMCNSCGSYKCTCLSNCICCNCCSPEDVEAEMRRLAAIGRG